MNERGGKGEKGSANHFDVGMPMMGTYLAWLRNVTSILLFVNTLSTSSTKKMTDIIADDNPDVPTNSKAFVPLGALIFPHKTQMVC